MNNSSLLKASMLAFVLVAATVVFWELYLRHQGWNISYDEGGSLWSNKRKQVYEPKDKATVFIGSSRIKFDLDIPTWQNITGDEAIQLANVGSSPRPILSDLADDKNFKGKLVIDVTEGLFFSTAPQPNVTPLENLTYYKKETPAQKFSFIINHGLESQLVFLDKGSLSLNALIDNANIPNRPGVFQFPHFPSDFGKVSFERQNSMTDKFVKDTSLQNQVKNIWNFFRQVDQSPHITPGGTDTILATLKLECDKIKARGGQVIFVRTPSSGPILLGENMGFPRAEFWDKLLSVTGCPGIHFADYPAIAHFECPEFSHLSRPQAISFTKTFIKILEEKGWHFANRSIASR